MRLHPHYYVFVQLSIELSVRLLHLARVSNDARQVPPLAHIGSGTLRRVNRNIVVSEAEKEKSAFSAALDARRRCEIGQWREV